jgi:hypothetical protein
MARAKVIELPLLTGAVTDDTVLASKFYATDMDKVRARGKRWETIKGWKSFNALGMSSGIARGIHAYSDLDGNPVLVAASESDFTAWMGGNRINISQVERCLADASQILKGVIPGTTLLRLSGTSISHRRIRCPGAA